MLGTGHIQFKKVGFLPSKTSHLLAEVGMLICDQIQSKKSAVPPWKVLGIPLEMARGHFQVCKGIS